MNLILKPLRFFFFNALKPWEELFENLEAIMHMDKIMSTESEDWELNNQDIPIWFYKMVISIGVALSFGFLLILLGSLW